MTTALRLLIQYIDKAKVFCRISTLLHDHSFFLIATMKVNMKTADEKQKALKGAVLAYHAQQKSIKLIEKI